MQSYVGETTNLEGRWTKKTNQRRSLEGTKTIEEIWEVKNSESQNKNVSAIRK